MNDADLEILAKKIALLECQYHKQADIVPFCQDCTDRFNCHTMKARRFRIEASNTYTKIYVGFAENKDQLQEMIDEWGEDGFALCVDDGDTYNEVDVTEMEPGEEV